MRRVRRKIKKAINNSALLKKEFRQAKKLRKLNVPQWLFRFFMAFILGMLVFRTTVATGHPLTGMAVITLYLSVWTIFQTQGLWSFLYGHKDIGALRMLPVSDAAIFNWQLQKFFIRAGFSLFDLLIGFGGLSWYLNFPPSHWLAVPVIAATAWMAMLALAFLCLLHAPRRVFLLIYSALCFGGFAMIFVIQMAASQVVAFLDRFASDLNTFLPTGWPVSLFELFLPEAHMSALLLSLPVLLTIASLAYSIRRLRKGYHFAEQIMPEAPDIIQSQEGEPALKSGATHSFLDHAGETAIEEMIHSRQFLAQDRWDRKGWFESRLWKWMNPREKVLGEFAFPRGYSIAKPWRSTYRNLLGFLSVGFAAGLVSPTGRIWILGAGLVITAVQALAQVLMSGTAFRSVFCSGVNIPLYANLGIGYRELAQFLIKCSIVQLPLFIPFVMAWTMVITFLNGMPWQAGIVLGFKAALLIFSSRFILIMAGFSKCSNDTTISRLWTFFLVIIALGMGLAFIGLGGAGLFVPDTIAAWMLWAAAILDAYFLFRVYGWFYNKNRFDLMSLPR